MNDVATWAQNYGPGFLALVLLLQFLSSLLPKILGSKPEEAQRELARSMEKLALVLERIGRDQEKALDEVKDTLRETLAVVQRVDIVVADIKAKATLSTQRPHAPN